MTAQKTPNHSFQRPVSNDGVPPTGWRMACLVPVVNSVALLVLAALMAAVTPARADTNPTATVENLHTALLGIMKDADSLGFDGRLKTITPVIDESFDFPTIARIVSGKAWKTASDEDKQAFIDVFKQLSAATYASNFSGYGGEQFVSGAVEDSRGAKIVRTELVPANDEPIPLNYMLRQTEGRWLIVNVIAKGVSDLSLKRAEYAAVISSEGFAGLTRRLEEKLRQMGAAN